MAGTGDNAALHVALGHVAPARAAVPPVHGEECECAPNGDDAPQRRIDDGERAKQPRLALMFGIVIPELEKFDARFKSRESKAALWGRPNNVHEVPAYIDESVEEPEPVADAGLLETGLAVQLVQTVIPEVERQGNSSDGPDETEKEVGGVVTSTNPFCIAREEVRHVRHESKNKPACHDNPDSIRKVDVAAHDSVRVILGNIVKHHRVAHGPVLEARTINCVRNVLSQPLNLEIARVQLGLLVAQLLAKVVGFRTNKARCLAATACRRSRGRRFRAPCRCRRGIVGANRSCRRLAGGRSTITGRVPAEGVVL
eukprot:Opistho-2@32922